MKILAADDEQPALNILTRAIREAVPNAELRSFHRTVDLLTEIGENGFAPDAAFLDIEMPGASGLELAKQIKERCPAVNIVFTTGFSQYALQAMSLRPSGYVIKPGFQGKNTGGDRKSQASSYFHQPIRAASCTVLWEL